MSTSLPGISFEAAPPPLAESLPRMDIAGFVGFAERGPIGIPVPVEDLERFRDVFGGPVALARDEETGRMDTSHLLPAVDAFFQNGGRRCWVVRVGTPLDDRPRSRYQVPGLVVPFSSEEEASSVEAFAPAGCRARSQGSGFDDVRIGSVLRQRVLPDGEVGQLSGGGDEEGPWFIHWKHATGLPDDGDLLDGELLRLAFGGEHYLEGAFRPVSIGETNRDGEAEDRIVHSEWVHAFERNRSPLHDPSLDHEQWTVDGEVFRNQNEGGDELTAATLRRREDDGYFFTLTPTQDIDTWGAGPWRARLELQSPSSYEQTVLVGELRAEGPDLHFRIEESEHPVWGRIPGPDETTTEERGPLRLRCQLTSQGRADTYLIQQSRGVPPDVDEGEETDDFENALTAGALIRVEERATGRVGWFQLGSPTSPVSLQARGQDGPVGTWKVRDHRWPMAPRLLSGSVRSILRLRMDLLTWRGRELVDRIEELGFTQGHPRGWMHLPTDETMFGFEEAEPPRLTADTLEAEVHAPRPDWAGPAEPVEVTVPFGMANRPDPSQTHGRQPDGTTRRQRDGIDHFRADLFFDEGLASASTEELSKRADKRVFVEPNSLPRGLHSLWPVREVTLLGLPDAYHREWAERPTKEEERTPTPVPVPSLEEVEIWEGNPSEIHLSWSLQAEEAASFEVQESTDPSFSSPTVLYRGADTETIRYVRSDRAQRFYFRVRSSSSGKTGGWSVTRSAQVPAPDFVDCSGPLQAPSARCEEEGHRGDTIEFDPLDPAPQDLLHYEVQVASEPTFSSPRTSKRPPPEGEGPVRVSLGEHRPVLSYARVRAVGRPASNPTPGPWSCTVVLKRPLPTRRVLESPHEYDRGGSTGEGRDGLLRVQRSALRFAAARGDVLVMLGGAEHDQAEQLRTHLQRLTTLSASSSPDGGRLGHEEERTLSFGALYHPWLMYSSEGTADIHPVPPGGAICGLAASQALDQGAWFPPANVGLEGTRSLAAFRGAPSEAPDRLNFLRETPRGVLTLDATTLAPDELLRPLPARRTLSLVRRLALREGPELVFESHGPKLRRRVAEQFEGLLRHLFEQGALAGAIPSEAYRVVADDSVNPPAVRERGEMVVELRVAPSRPLEFLTVRLVQREGSTVAVSS